MTGLVRVTDQSVTHEDDRTVNVLVYSDDRTTRDEVKAAVGRRPGKGGPTIEWHEAATEFGVLDLVQSHDFDLMIFDGEAAKVGGMGLCRQVKDEVAGAPPILVLIARQMDEWLGRWSGADDMTTFPVDPREIQAKVSALLKVGR